MTERIYYRDCYAREFRASVVDRSSDGLRVYLDQTAFYPTSGGQPFDFGSLGGITVREIVDEDDRIAHLLESPLSAQEVTGTIDWARRYDHMQQHTGQHLLSAVLEELHAIKTVSFHMGAETSTIDVDAATVSVEKIQRAEERCAEIVAQARPVAITFEDASDDLGLRKASEREGVLRIVSIEGIDRSACGGTHVRTTAEVGPVLIRKAEKIRGTIRLEFVCGKRALNAARGDYQLLSEIARTLSAPIERGPELVGALIEKNKVLEKSAGRLTVELARREGMELYAATSADADGVRRLIQRGGIDDAMRTRAQAFVAGEKAAFLVVCEQPPSLLLAVSADSGIHAGNRVKAFLGQHGGRGGGNATLAQGRVPEASALSDPLVQSTLIAAAEETHQSRMA